MGVDFWSLTLTESISGAFPTDDDRIGASEGALRDGEERFRRYFDLGLIRMATRLKFGKLNEDCSNTREP